MFGVISSLRDALARLAAAVDGTALIIEDANAQLAARLPRPGAPALEDGTQARDDGRSNGAAEGRKVRR